MPLKKIFCDEIQLRVLISDLHETGEADLRIAIGKVPICWSRTVHSIMATPVAFCFILNNRLWLQ